MRCEGRQAALSARLLASVIVLLLAACSGPPSEFTGTWLRPDEEPADRGPREFEVRSLVGSDHCDWESVVFLSIAWPLGTTYEAGPDAPPVRQYVRDVEGDLGAAADRLLGELQLDAELPDDARDTGYHTGQGAELWLADDADVYVYLVVEGDVERWPRAEPAVACA